MINLIGKFEEANIMTDVVDEATISQIYNLLNQEFIKGNKIRFMPDLHAGKGCVIGTTMTLNSERVCPNLVGVDIGCGVLVVNLGKNKIDLEGLDKFVRENIPSGHNVDSRSYKSAEKMIRELHCYDSLTNIERLQKSLGSLGGGNHFIEMDIDDYGCKYLVIHSGSRNLGKQVAEYYQDLAIKNMNKFIKGLKTAAIAFNKEMGYEYYIEKDLKKINDLKVPDELCYLMGNSYRDYLHDIKIVQDFADENRFIMAYKIVVHFLGLYTIGSDIPHFESVHNYIDIEGEVPVLRKGAISAKKGEKVVIPINMRDGTILGTGLGNLDWNESAPHGAGRLMSRSKAKQNVTLDEFKDSMSGIYSTSVCESTIDESPMVYKSLDYILENIKETVKVDQIIKPIYSFKAS